MKKPIVTVLIDTYNHERFIEQAIASVLEQDFPFSEAEIIVVDDGSTDPTPELVRRFEPRVRLLRKTNGGQASAFNAGILEARGEIVAFLDGDDWWAPNKVSRVVEAITSDPSLGIVGHGIVMVQLDGREQTEILREGFRFRADTVEGARLLRVRGSLLGTSRMTIRAEVLRQIGRIPEAIVVQADEYLSTLAAVLAGVQILPETLAFYRLHEANGFQMSTHDPHRMRRKQLALGALSTSLSERLTELGIEPRVNRTVLEFIQASAEQLRLMLDGGWSWETVKTEQTIYAVLHPNAPFSHRLFKMMTLLPAAAVPPRFYYGIRQKLSESDLYLRARKRWLPIPEMSHLNRDSRTGS